MISAIHNPFLSLGSDFKVPKNGGGLGTEGQIEMGGTSPRVQMFATSPEDIEGSWLENNGRFKRGIDRLGGILNGGR